MCGGVESKEENDMLQYTIITRTFLNVKGKLRQHSHSSLAGKDHHHHHCEFDITAQYESQSIIIQCVGVATY